MGKFHFTVELSINWLRLIILLGLLSIVLYILVPRAQTDLGYAIAVLGGIGILITAINDIEVRREAIHQGKLKAALGFVHEWNHPLFFHAKTNGRETLRRFKEKGETDHEFLKANPQHLGNLIDIMNFVELLSVSIQMGEADEPAVKRFFRGILIEYWQHAEPWVEAEEPRKLILGSFVKLNGCITGGNPRLKRVVPFSISHAFIPLLDFACRLKDITLRN